MAHDEAISAGVKDWLSENREEVSAALNRGAELGAEMIALVVSRSLDKWFQANTRDLITAIAQQMAVQKPKDTVETK